MKKILLTLVAIVAFSAINAQYKAVKGDFATDFGLGGISYLSVNPYDNNFMAVDNNHPFAGLASKVVKLRYFNSDNSAVRASVLIYNHKETVEANKVEEITSNSLFTFGLGYEKHFEGTDRLDPFIAGDLMYTKVGGKYDETDSSTSTVTEYHQEGGNSLFGVRVSIGADYYIAKKLFLGAELGLGIHTGVDGKSKVSGTGLTTTEVDGTKIFAIVPGMVGGLKIGYAF